MAEQTYSPTPEHRVAIAQGQKRRHERNRRIEELIEELHELVAKGKRR